MSGCKQEFLFLHMLITTLQKWNSCLQRIKLSPKKKPHNCRAHYRLSSISIACKLCQKKSCQTSSGSWEICKKHGSHRGNWFFVAFYSTCTGTTFVTMRSLIHPKYIKWTLRPTWSMPPDLRWQAAAFHYACVLQLSYYVGDIRVKLDNFKIHVKRRMWDLSCHCEKP